MEFRRAWRLMRSPVRARFLRLLGSSHYADVLADVLAEQQRAYYAAEGVRMFSRCAAHPLRGARRNVILCGTRR